jgi:hypothetical protein
MTTRALRFAIAIGFACPLTVAITGAAYAALTASCAIGVKAAAPFAATNVSTGSARWVIKPIGRGTSPCVKPIGRT